MADISKHIEKADKYLQRGKAEDALEELKAALDAEPENTLVRERACDICISLNRQREATNLLSDLLDRYFAASDQTRAIDRENQQKRGARIAAKGSGGL